MTFRPRAPLSLTLAAISITVLSSCAKTPPPVVAVAPPVPQPAYLPMPAGTYRNMPVPPILSDGSYATPNRALSAAGTVWHLRTGLNFAALACRGAEEAGVIAGYNAMLAAQKPVLAGAERALAAEYRSAGGAEWRDGYDDSMTRLYNYWSMAAARPALCATADRVLAEAASVPQASFADFAAARLPELDAAITDVYRAYDAWRNQGRMPQPTYAVAANAPVAQMRPPWIEVDPAVLRMP